MLYTSKRQKKKENLGEIKKNKIEGIHQPVKKNREEIIKEMFSKLKKNTNTYLKGTTEC